jgi:uncharacterized membrane protein YhdT
MLQRLVQSARQSALALRRRWPLVLVLALLGGWVAFAFWLSDIQGRMDLPRAYSVRMTCEDDLEAALWRGGCERVEADIAKMGRPSFGDLYAAFVQVHHVPSPGAAAARSFKEAPADPAFDVQAMLAGQRYGLALVTPEFEGVKSRAHAEAVMDEIDKRDRALLAIGRAGLSQHALLAGALANLANPGVMIDGARQYAAILLGTAKESDLATGLSGTR